MAFPAALVVCLEPSTNLFLLMAGLKICFILKCTYCIILLRGNLKDAHPRTLPPSPLNIPNSASQLPLSLPFNTES